jgi:thiamine pyrophosphate-dependent acetolactate synthase large subunit-like protein
VPLFGGVFAIFGHGNVAGIGEALYQHRRELPTYRAHNEQAMAHAAIAYAKAHMRRRMMACTTSIGPGATNLVTAAALAHVNRLPVLMLPGDVFGFSNGEARGLAAEIIAEPALVACYPRHRAEALAESDAAVGRASMSSERRSGISTEVPSSMKAD